MSPHDDDPELSRLVRDNATRHAAPDHLRARIRAQVALAEAARANRAEARKPRRWWPVGPALASARWGVPVAAFAAGMLCMALLLPVWQRIGPSEPIEAELVMDHVRALRGNALIQVASSDRHTVKPWFQGRIDYAPPVFDFASDGFALVGGRVGQVRGQATATLVYARNQHRIDLFIQPSAATEAPLRTAQRGFNVIRWADGSMQYWLVADVERDEADAFVRLWQARAAPK